MARPSSSLLVRDARPPLWLGAVGAVGAVAVTTALIFPLRTVVPVVSTGVVYLLAVLLVSSWFGLWAGLGTAVASALAFNWFHIPPTGRFTIAEPENWVALAVFLVAAVIVSTLAELARARAVEAKQRRREADLAADLARLLLGGPDVAAALAPAAQRLADALDLSSAAIEVGPQDRGDDPTRLSLRADEREIASLRLGAQPSEAMLEHLRSRVVPSLEALLVAALDREALQREVVEAQALRRSDDIKTALLRAVSHDLRSPLTAIGHRVLVRIVDRGPGIPERVRERIFEPFYRSPTSVDDGHAGSGLGLAVVRGFVEANGGRVWVESLSGQGATFVVELPLPVQEPADTALPVRVR